MEKEMKRKPKVPKERNAGVFQLIKRAGAGSCALGKNKQAERRAAKISLQKQMDPQLSWLEHLTFNQGVLRSNRRGFTKLYTSTLSSVFL